METRAETAQLQLQKISANLVRANALLQCTNAEILEIVDQEQRWNPAIEPIDKEPGPKSGCPQCPLGGKPACVVCLYPHELPEVQSDNNAPSHSTVENTTFDDAPAWDRDDRFGMAGTSVSPSSDFDRLSYAPAPSTLAQELRWQLGVASSRAFSDAVCEYLIDGIDGQGYLRIDPAEACALLGISPEELEAAVRALQSCEPAGIGARDLRECLLLQIEQWPDSHDMPADPLAMAIIRDHWDLFVHQRQPQLMRQLHAGAAQVDKAMQFIQEKLTPYPAGQYRERWRHRPDGLSDAIRPDVAIARGAHGFSVEISGSSYLNLQVSPHYRRLADQIRQNTRRKGNTAADAENEQVLDCVGRAENLLANLRRRNWALKRIAGALVEHQQGFLETGKRTFMRPLTRTQLAQELGMHESTVSRALMHKYVQLPSQEVVPFDCFFKGPSTGHEVIAQLIAGEDPASPLSDLAIAEALAERGISAARRTVAKYREELRISPSHLRRRR